MLKNVYPHVLTEEIQHVQLCAIIWFYLPCSTSWVEGHGVSETDAGKGSEVDKSFSVCSHHLVGRAKFCSWSIFLWRNEIVVGDSIFPYRYVGVNSNNKWKILT